MFKSKQTTACHGRSAFTLVEVLIVIAIIGLLASMLAFAIAPAVENARIASTKALIAVIDNQLQARLTAFNAIDFKNQYEILQAQNPGQLSEAAAKAIVKKNRYRAAFPQRVEDLYGYDNNVADGTPFAANAPLYRTLLEYNNGSLPSNITSSELVYLLLTRGAALGTETYSIDGIPGKSLTDENGNGLMEIRDAWGNEIEFYNAPTGLFRPDPSAATDGLTNLNLTLGARVHFSSIPGDDGVSAAPQSGELYQDPFDRFGRTPNSTLFNADQYYHPMTYFSFLIVSAGPDGELGLHKPNESGVARLAQPLNVADLTPLFDNLTNHQK